VIKIFNFIINLGKVSISITAFVTMVILLVFLFSRYKYRPYDNSDPKELLMQKSLYFDWGQRVLRKLKISSENNNPNSFDYHSYEENWKLIKELDQQRWQVIIACEVEFERVKVGSELRSFCVGFNEGDKSFNDAYDEFIKKNGEPKRSPLHFRVLKYIEVWMKFKFDKNNTGYMYLRGSIKEIPNTD